MGRTRFDPRLLANFAAVAEHQSFTKAAEQLSVAKGTVSRGVSQLERQLSTELLHRTTQQVALSTAGEALYEQIRPHLRGLEEAMVGLPEQTDMPTGRLRLTAPPDFGGTVLPDLLSSFARRYPEVSFDVSLTNTHVDLVADGYDLGIRASSRLEDSALKARRLRGVEVKFYGSPTYLARAGRPKTFADSRQDWILHTAALSSKKCRHIKPRFACDDFLLMRSLASTHAGIAMLPAFVANPFVRDGLLDEVSLRDAPPLAGRLFLVYPSRGQVPAKVLAFRDFLLNWRER